MFHMNITSSPFKHLLEQETGTEARRKLFRTAGAYIQREAKAGAGRAIGGGFGRDIAATVNKELDPDGVTIGAAHFAAAHKQFGGKISAPGKGPMSRKAKYLAIPIAPESKKKNPGDFAIKLFTITSKKGNKILMGNFPGGAKPLFLLRKSVTQKAYPWFPLGAEAEKALDKAVKNYIATKNSNGG